MDIDRMLLDYLRATYPDKRAPWNNTYQDNATSQEIPRVIFLFVKSSM